MMTTRRLVSLAWFLLFLIKFIKSLIVLIVIISCYFLVADPDGRAKLAISVSFIPDASMDIAMDRRGSVSATQTGAEYCAIKVYFLIYLLHLTVLVPFFHHYTKVTHMLNYMASKKCFTHARNEGLIIMPLLL